ncbi:site-specific tyrosine recombinase XerC [Paraburkholderia sediminicola]|uniref:site-specific tyrosine recombinase XerC n=3 Tax=Paraburkholderia sediminicola TaxID=458836 RepID=UPI0038B8B438
MARVKQRLRKQREGGWRTQEKPTNALMAYVHLYMDWLAMTGCTPATQRTHQRGLERFVRWFDTRGLSQPEEITRAVLETWQRHLYLHRKTDGQALAIRSQRSLLLSIKGLCQWLARQRYVQYNAGSELVLPRKPHALPKVVLSVAQVEALMGQPDLESVTGMRDRALLEVLYSTGMRRMEIAQLQLGDIDLETRTIAIRQGKGRRDRFVPMGERACAWVKRYLLEERTALVVGTEQWTLFLTDYGTAFTLGALSGIVTRYMRRAGIGKGSCHALRHACATHMLDNGADVRFIQMLLGHADLTSTQIYTHVSIGKLREIHAATHPAGLGEQVREPDDGGESAASLLAAIEAEADDEDCHEVNDEESMT